MSQPLAAGELIYVTDTKSIWIGDGTTVGGVPVANLSITDIQNIDANLFTNGTHTGITFTYVPNPSNPGLSKINATVNVELSNYAGTIKADAFKGTLVGDDSTILVDAVSGKINLSGTVKGDIVPNTTNAYTLGTPTYKFKDLYLDGPSLHLGAATISAVSSVIDLPAGSTVGGVAIGSGGGGGSTDRLTSGSYSLILGSDGKITLPNGRIDTNASTIILQNSNPTTLKINGITDGTLAGTSSIEIDAQRGTLASPVTTQAGDYLARLTLAGWNGTNYLPAGSVYATWDYGAVLSDAYPKSNLVFTTGAGGSNTTYAYLNPIGIFVSPMLNTTIYSVAGTPLPSASTVGLGARAFVSDATSTTFAAAYTGGGSNKVPVYSDGTAWHIG
jgi:hypothetical protein